MMNLLWKIITYLVVNSFIKCQIGLLRYFIYIFFNKMFIFIMIKAMIISNHYLIKSYKNFEIRITSQYILLIFDVQ